MVALQSEYIELKLQFEQCFFIAIKMLKFTLQFEHSNSKFEIKAYYINKTSIYTYK